jgi:hypothetical protein
VLVAALLACGEPAAPPAPAPLPYVAPPADQPVPDVLTDPPTSGQACRDDEDCPDGAHQGHCFCAWPLPEGGVETTGFCWNGLVKTEIWWCTVEGGHAMKMGLIFP